MSKSIEIDFDNVCRTCLSTTNLKSLYGEKSTQNCYNEMLQICASVECFEHDGLPVQICTECINELNRSYKFASNCRETDKLLRIYRHKLVPKIYAIPQYSATSVVQNSNRTNPLEMSQLQIELVVVKNEINHKIKAEPDNIDHFETIQQSVGQFNDVKLEDDQPVDSNEQANLMLLQQNEVAKDCDKTDDTSYSCLICDKGFARRKYLNSHMRTHTKDKSFSCTGTDMGRKSKILYKRFKYTEEQLKEAIDHIRQGKITQNAASIKYGIPKGTLNMKVRNLVPMERKMGPDTVLTKLEETKICDWILSKAKLGFPMHATDVQDAIQVVMEQTKRPNLFKNNRPGIKWLKLFLKRHPEVARRNKEILAKERGTPTEDSINNWFSELKQYLDTGGYDNILNNPTRVFSADESGVQFCTTTGGLLGPKRYRHLSEIACNDKECVTVLYNFSAAGLKVSPMLVMPYKQIPKDISASIPNTYFIKCSETGWITSETFHDYIRNCFYPWLLLNNIELPVILFLDGHKSHISVSLFEFCVEKQILIYCVLPNATKVLKPCDVSVFKMLKHAWLGDGLNYKKSNVSIPITKVTMASILKKAIDTSITTDIISAGFRACGLYPTDPINALNQLCITQT